MIASARVWARCKPPAPKQMSSITAPAAPVLLAVLPPLDLLLALAEAPAADPLVAPEGVVRPPGEVRAGVVLRN